MALLSVNTASWLVPWGKNGLEYIVADEDLPAPFSLTKESAPHVPTRPRRPADINAPTPAGLRHIAKNSTKNAAAHDDSWADEEKPRSVPSRPAPAASSSTAAPAAPKASAKPVQSIDAAVPDVSQMPQAWRSLLGRLKPGRVLWTYEELGLDLCGHADPARRSFLQGIIKNLAYPAGTYTFWPCALPETDAAGQGSPQLVPSASCFWAGVHALGARMVIVLGSRASEIVLSEALMPLTQTRSHNCFVWVLRDVNSLIQNRTHYSNSVNFLRTHLSFLLH